MADEDDATGVVPTEQGEVVETEAHTEMADVVDAKPGSIYAWALDDDPDEVPTVPSQWMTSRRITTLAVTASLIVVAVAGVVAFIMVRGTDRPPVATQAPSPPPVATQAPSPPVVQTAVVAPPPAPSPSSTPLPAPEAPEVGRAREESFLAALDGTPINGPNHVSYSMIPGSHGAYMGDPSAWTVGGPVVKYAYEACAVLKKHPSDREQATAVFYEEHGYDTKSASASTKQEMATYMQIAATYLCG
jgi:hypothetical protein